VTVEKELTAIFRGRKRRVTGVRISKFVGGQGEKVFAVNFSKKRVIESQRKTICCLENGGEGVERNRARPQGQNGGIGTGLSHFNCVFIKKEEDPSFDKNL